MHILFGTKYREQLLQRPCWRIKAGAFVALWVVATIGARADAQPCPPVVLTLNNKPAVSAETSCKKDSSTTPDYADPVAGVTLRASRTRVAVSNVSQLNTAIQGAACGTDIVVAAGTYSGATSFDRNCPVDNPVILRGAANFGTVLTGQMQMTGAHNIVTGVKFSGEGSSVYCRGTNNKVLGNRFEGTGRVAVQLAAEISPAVACEVAYNEISKPAAWDTCQCPGDPMQFRQAIKMNTAGTGQSNTAQRSIWIHHNYIHSWVNKCDPACFDSSDADVIEIGESGSYDWAPTFQLGAYIEDNLMENLTQVGQAAMDLKIGGNVVRRNSLIDAPSQRLSGRIGPGSVWESNWVPNGAIVTNQRNSVVACNYVRGQQIRVQAGTMEWNAVGPGYPRSVNARVVKNDGPLIVGHQYNENHTLAAQNTVIEEHKGSIELGLQTGTVDKRNSPSAYTCPVAVPLSPSQVGPGALSQAPAAYRAARGL